MRNNQLGRRNLLPYIRTKLALELEETIAARAKGNQKERKGEQPGATCQKSDNLIPVDTKRELAAIAGVSHDTVAKVKKIEAKADDLLAEIAEQVEKQRVEKIAEAMKGNLNAGQRAAIAAELMPMESMEEQTGQKIVRSVSDEHSTKSATKAAELFNHWPPP